MPDANCLSCDLSDRYKPSNASQVYAPLPSYNVSYEGVNSKGTGFENVSLRPKNPECLH